MVDQEMLEAMRLLIREETKPLKEDLASVRDDLAGVKEDLAGVKEDLAGVKEDLAGVKEDLAGVKEDLAGVKEDLVGVKEDLDGVKEDLAGVKEDLAGVKFLLEADIYPKIELLAEGHEGLVENQRAILDRLSHVESMEVRFAAVEGIVRMHSMDIQELKKAQ